MFATRRNDPRDRFRSARSLAMGRRGMVCTSHALASSAGLAALRAGGNAIDAAVCAAAVLGVVEPYNTGIGGDCFALAWSAREGRLLALNGSGRAPAGLDLDLLRARGLAGVPMQGMLPVTVPGALDAWSELLARLGTWTLAEALAPAIELAEDGFPVTEIVSHQWGLAVRFGLLSHPDALRSLTHGGEAPRLGAIFRMPDLARSMREIAAGGAEAFYRGPIARRIARFSGENGGVLAEADLAAHRSTWVEPITARYRGLDVFELPPNGQGIAALVALQVLDELDLSGLEPGAPELVHLRIEAVKLAYADRDRWIADPEHAEVPTEALLSRDYARARASRIDRRRAMPRAEAGVLGRGSDTVYLATADAEGNVVSLINSLYMAFGSGLVAGDTGIVLQNRGFGFSTDPSHPNCVAPGKRPFHTIIPAMAMREGRPLVAFGVMGGDVQAQAHVQVVSNLVDCGMNVQEALDAPRFHYVGGAEVALEPDAGDDLVRALAGMGHVVRGEDAVILRGGFGGGQGIMVDPATGAYWGGSDRRKDGCAIGW